MVGRDEEAGGADGAPPGGGAGDFRWGGVAAFRLKRSIGGGGEGEATEVVEVAEGVGAADGEYRFTRGRPWWVKQHLFQHGYI